MNQVESKFYSRATGKLNKTSRQSYTSPQVDKKAESTVYSIEDDETISNQYPLPSLSSSQVRFMNEFIREMTGNNMISVDPDIRGIYQMGIWRISDQNVTVSCSLLQPNIVNSTVHIRGLNSMDGKRYSKIYFSPDDEMKPYISGNKCCQVMGKYSMPYTDTLIQNQIIEERHVSWSLIVMSKTQPIFVVISSDGIFECCMSYISCQIISQHCPPTARISAALSTNHNYAFRNSQLVSGLGTAGSITVHSSGILQYQGKPQDIKLVASSFRDCILSIMDSEYSLRFIKSLSVLRKIS